MEQNKDNRAYEDQGKRIKNARISVGFLHAKDMAKELNIDPVRYGHYERGRSEMPKEILEKFCLRVGIDPLEIIYSNVSQLVPEKKTSQGHINIIGEVQAGTWKEARQWDREDWEIEYFNASATETNAYGLRVVGDSMDEHYPPGSTVIVLPIHDYLIPIQSYDHVIVERSRGGDIYELTIKELVIKDGKAELWPRSKNPKYRDPINLFWPYEKLQHHGIETVEIKGVVIGSVNRRRRF